MHGGGNGGTTSYEWLEEEESWGLAAEAASISPGTAWGMDNNTFVPAFWVTNPLVNAEIGGITNDVVSSS
jgi:hypothetical protein